MKEININIEGYNVNGICVGCLNYNREMFYHEDIKECFRLLGNIDVPDGLEIQVCWECLAYIRSAIRFKKQMLKSFEFLMAYSREHTFLDSPNDFIVRATKRLVITKLETCICAPKEEPLDISEDKDIYVKEEIEEIEELEPHIKEEVLDESIFSDAPFDDGNSTDEDVQLSQLKVKQTGKKKKKIKEDKVEIELSVIEEPPVVPIEENINLDKKMHKMRNLSEELVELYTMSTQDMKTVRKEDRNSIEFLKIKNRCDHCIIGFNTARKMQEHFKGKHLSKGPNSYLCSICNAYLAKKEQIPLHESNHLLGFKCRRCGFLTALKRRMVGHLASHAAADCHTCWTCGTNFSTKSKLTYHRAICQQERPQCDCCGKVFANKMTLKYHLKATLKSKSENKEEKPKEKLKIQCKHCNKLYRTKKSYRSHVVIHDGVSYPCDICGKLFQWKRNLARHLRNHRERESGARHECRECGKTFASRECLNQHMTLSKKHVAEDNFHRHECNYCGKKYATKWCLTDHIDWDHLKLIKYQCTICFKAFKTSKIMVAHVNNVHEGKKEPEGEHLCEICGKSYKTVKRLKSHVSVTHTKRKTGKNYKCKLCAATFTWPTSIYKHMKMMHASQNKSPRRVKKEDPYKDSQNLTRVQYYQQNVGGNLSIVSIQPMDVAQEITYP